MGKLKDGILTDVGLLEQDFDLIKDEDIFQIDKWGRQSHHMFEWLAYITEELGELSQAISEYWYRDGDKSDIAKEAIQVATLALKMAVMSKGQTI